MTTQKSWKTTVGGSVAAFGTFLFGAPVALAVVNHELIPPKVVVVMVVTGFVLMGAGQFLTGLFGRDNDKTSEDVGVDENTKILKKLSVAKEAVKEVTEAAAKQETKGT